MLRSNHAGHTLAELLIVIGLLAILANIALPALGKMQQERRNEAAFEAMNNLLHHARAQALIQKRTLELCPSADGVRCSTDWNLPWLLRAANDREALNHSTPFPGDVAVRWQGFTDSIRFRSNGTSPAGNGRFYFCLDGQITHQLILNRQGRVRKGSHQENLDESARCR